jgi:cytochrome oxidase Cu insertion factor (SCO1/SenC/PrrC family)
VRVVFSLIALALAPFSWFWSIDDAALRASGATVWVMLTSALFLGLTAAWRDARLWVRAVVALELVVGALFLWGFFAFARLPQAVPPRYAPDFTLPDHEGRPVTLSEELRKGPVLLVFFRGHW